MSELTNHAKGAWRALLVSHAVLTKEIDGRLAQAGVVPLDVYDVLLQLEDAAHQRMRMSDLADAVILSRSGLTRLVDRLESEGLIQRATCPKDRRALYAVLTPKGLAERERAWPAYRKAIAEVFGKFMSDEEATTVESVLDRTIAARRAP